MYFDETIGRLADGDEAVKDPLELLDHGLLSPFGDSSVRFGQPGDHSLDTFTFSRQTATFLCVLAILDLVSVAMFPIMAIIVALLAVLIVFLVWINAGVRTGKWFWWNPARVPLTQIEGALALSAAVLISIGILESGYEALRLASGKRNLLEGYIWYQLSPRRVSTPVGSRSVSHSNPEIQKEFKDALAKAGVPYTLETRNGEEFVVWSPEYNDAVRAAERKVSGMLEPDERNVSFGDPAQQKEFMEWLAKQGFASRIEIIRGKETVIWKGGPETIDTLKKFAAEHPGTCKDKEASSAQGRAGASRC